MKQNYVILHDKDTYYIFERLGKQVPFEAYNIEKHLGKGASVEEALSNSSVPVHQIEEKPVEVMFNV